MARRSTDSELQKAARDGEAAKIMRILQIAAQMGKVGQYMADPMSVSAQLRYELVLTNSGYNSPTGFQRGQAIAQAGSEKELVAVLVDVIDTEYKNRQKGNYGDWSRTASAIGWDNSFKHEVRVTSRSSLQLWWAPVISIEGEFYDLTPKGNMRIGQRNALFPTIKVEGVYNLCKQAIEATQLAKDWLNAASIENAARSEKAREESEKKRKAQRYNLLREMAKVDALVAWKYAQKEDPEFVNAAVKILRNEFHYDVNEET